MSGGFPDFQKIVRWLGPAIVDGATIYIGADVLLGPFHVGTYKSVTIFCNPGAAGLRMQITFRPTSATLNIPRMQTLMWTPSVSHAITIPTAGDIIDSIRLTGNANPQTISLVIFPSNLDPWVKYGTPNGILGYRRSSAMGVGGSNADTLLEWTGAARIVFNASAYPCLVSLTATDYTGAQIGIAWEHPAVAGPINDAVLLTPTINRFGVTNNSGVAITYSYSVIGELKP